MLGPARVHDTQRTRNQEVEEDATSPVMNWSCRDKKLVQELMHRFRPKLVINATPSCACVQAVFVNMNIQCVAICSMSS